MIGLSSEMHHNLNKELDWQIKDSPSWAVLQFAFWKSDPNNTDEESVRIMNKDWVKFEILKLCLMQE